MGCRNLLNQLGLSDDSFVSVARPASADALLILRSACRHCEERSDEAIQAECRKPPGLLRYARNDGTGVGDPEMVPRRFLFGNPTPVALARRP
jgi:hypothetical protein